MQDKMLDHNIFKKKFNKHLKSYITPPKSQLNKRAFSIAEAMIALLIGTIVLGFSAPLISRQIKQSNLNDIQVQILLRRIERLEQQTNNSLPEGSIIFLDSNTYNGCPPNWTMINQEGRFFKITTQTENIGYSEEANLPDHIHAIGEYTVAGLGTFSQRFFEGQYNLLANSDNTNLRLFVGPANGTWRFLDIEYEVINNGSGENAYTHQSRIDNGLITSLNIFDEFVRHGETSFAEPTNNFEYLQPKSYTVFACKYTPSH